MSNIQSKNSIRFLKTKWFKGYSVFLCVFTAMFFLLIKACSDDQSKPDYETGSVTDIDGNQYKTVKIGNQIWMAENLKTTHYNDSTAIEYPGEDISRWQFNSNGAYAWYGNDTIWKNIYGALYNWYAVNNDSGLCPNGWKIPSLSDWIEMVDYVISQGFPNEAISNGAAQALKSCRQINSPWGEECDTHEHPRWRIHRFLGFYFFGFDEFGFSALPGSYRWIGGTFPYPYYIIGYEGYWWSSTEESSSQAWRVAITSENSVVAFEKMDKRHGFSVRCFKRVDE